MKNYWLYASACAVLVTTSCKEEYDLDERLPDGFSTTLYSYLEDNGFQNVKRLADDLKEAEALQGRALRTMFIADDAAFARFYADNPWGVKRYEDLSLAQKKWLFYGSMIDQSIQVMNLSNTTSQTGPVIGNAMRRQSLVSYSDSVTVLPFDRIPQNKYWAPVLAQNKSVVIMEDMSVAPLAFFTEPFLKRNLITNDDVNFVYNYTCDRKAGDAFVANASIIGPNQRACNGFVHQVDEVLVPLDNMAGTLRTTPDLSRWSSFIERYCIPVYAGDEATAAYNHEYKTEVDSLFIRRYLSQRNQTGDPIEEVTLYHINGDAMLKFDPGWNAYYSDEPAVSDREVLLQKNMGVMLVPSDAALAEYWENGTGKILKDYYGTWENVPDRVLVKLLNNNMLNSFVNSVPSKFHTIVNSTQDDMGIKVDDVSRVILTGNGAIYVTNKVFSPTEYVSVSFPALINETMSVLNWGIEKNNYSPYVNSLDSYYSFFIPTNDALQNYIDPRSLLSGQKKMLKFFYDESKNFDQRVWAEVYVQDLETGEFSIYDRKETDANVLADHLKNILDNHIIIGDIESGLDYYQTKNGNTVYVQRDESGAVIGIKASYQILDKDDDEAYIPVTRIYDQTRGGNGKTYIIEAEPMMNTQFSCLDVIAAGDDHIFLDLVKGSEIRLQENDRSEGTIRTFKNFNYTIYVPTDEAMEALLSTGALKTWDEIDEMREYENVSEEMIQAEVDKINAFVRYHIQDNSVFVGQEFSLVHGVTQPKVDRKYETALLNENLKFRVIQAQVSPEGITLTDETGGKSEVITTPGSHNMPSCEPSSNSFAVVHKITHPLFFDKTVSAKYDKIMRPDNENSNE